MPQIVLRRILRASSHTLLISPHPLNLVLYFHKGRTSLIRTMGLRSLVLNHPAARRRHSEVALQACMPSKSSTEDRSSHTCALGFGPRPPSDAEACAASGLPTMVGDHQYSREAPPPSRSSLNVCYPYLAARTCTIAFTAWTPAMDFRNILRALGRPGGPSCAGMWVVG